MVIDEAIAAYRKAIELEPDNAHSDPLLHFKTKETGIACGDTEASLTGETFGGTPIEGRTASRPWAATPRRRRRRRRRRTGRRSSSTVWGVRAHLHTTLSFPEWS